MIRSMVLCFLVTLALAPAMAEQPSKAPSKSEAEQYQLRVGVRSHARPFSYRSDSMVDVLTAVTPGPLAQQQYTGYIVRICDAVLTEMMIKQSGAGSLSPKGVQVVDIDAEMSKQTEPLPNGRFGLLQNRTNGEELVEPLIDILCDPATITNARRSGLIISPPVYLTGVSYISQKGVARTFGDVDSGNCPIVEKKQMPPAVFHFGLVGHTTSARSGVQAFLTAEEMPQYRAALVDFLRGESKCQLDKEKEEILEKLQKESGLQIEGSVLLFKTHKQAAEAFCRGEVMHYIGDREIIVQSVSAIPGCVFNHGDRTFTADRYAIFGRIDYESDPDRALRVARFFEILSQKIVSHPSIIDLSFYDTFHPTSPTRTLDIFFRSVRGAP